MLFLLACLRLEAETPKNTSISEDLAEDIAQNIDIARQIPVQKESYPFLKPEAEVLRLEVKFPVPEGYQRVSLEEGSFGKWLRNIPVIDRTAVRAYDGSSINAPAAAIVPIDVGKGDVQQCADSILRLYAEYRWHQKTQDSWAIHFTSGDISTWKDWSAGKRFLISGSKVKQVQKAKADSSYAQYQKWLHHSFLYAGTKSLHLDATVVGLEQSIQPGDFFVTAGSPGHAIIVLDVAQHAEGQLIALLGQGFMPAQEFHVLRNANPQNKDWFILPKNQEDTLHNPSWSSISRKNVYRFP